MPAAVGGQIVKRLVEKDFTVVDRDGNTALMIECQLVSAHLDCEVLDGQGCRCQYCRPFTIILGC